MGWMEVYLDAYYGRLCISIRKLCQLYGIAHLADDVIGETFLAVCEKEGTYNPMRGSFVTWVMEYAKMVARRMIAPTRHVRYGGDKTSGISTRYEYMFAELVIEDELFAPTVFSDPFNVPGERAAKFLKSLTPAERACLKLLLRDKRVRFRQLGEELGVSHTHAGKLLPAIMSSLQAKSCILI